MKTSLILSVMLVTTRRDSRSCYQLPFAAS